ncbi:hypothetical protein MSAN_00451300 [Mycena sanguinolenta]|uniref:Mucoidy inhibitor A n=1 Tax=Mycena sanguinolenta TaxID=230812 RepID=A0A8H7DHI1_9AGAR|nr:hypothetical protein MSAN_00451300 [Mycena sanguinolenta]
MPSSLKFSARENPIKAVTVYKSHKAEVVRIFSLDLKSGNTKIEITELPSCIDTQSVRVSGLGDARLFDVVCTTRDEAGPNKSSEAVRLLKAQKLALEGEKRVRDHESDFLVTYAKTLKGEHVSPTQMGAFLESFVEQGRKNLQAVAELDEKLVVVNRQIEAELKKEATKKGDTTGEVTIVLGTDSDTHVNFKLTYLVSNASWESTYELHAATENGKPSSSVSLHYRARITQSTGEDWADTALTLSTVSASTVTKSIPWLNSLKIKPQAHRLTNAVGSNKGQTNNNFVHTSNSFQPSRRAPQVQQMQAPQTQMQAPQMQQMQVQQLQMQQMQQQALFGQTHTQGFPLQTIDQAASSADFEAEDFEDIDVPNAMAGPMTIVTETPLAISYAVEGATTVPSDGTVHQVSIAVLPFEAKISHICSPRVDPRVYLQCHVKNTSEYRLLPGPVSVVLNDGFVSKTSINEINTGDTFTCTLGDDVATKVTYARTSKTATSQGGSFQEVFNTTTYNTKITIHNKHPFALTDLVVREIIPTCDDKRAKVLLRKPVGLADARDGEVVKLTPPSLKVMWGKTWDGRPGEKDGRFEWAWSVEGGAKVMLEAEWELKAPADVVWVESMSA